MPPKKPFLALPTSNQEPTLSVRKPPEKSHAETRRCGASSRSSQKMKGGNEMSVANEVTLCSKRTYQTDAAKNLLWM